MYIHPHNIRRTNERPVHHTACKHKYRSKIYPTHCWQCLEEFCQKNNVHPRAIMHTNIKPYIHIFKEHHSCRDEYRPLVLFLSNSQLLIAGVFSKTFNKTITKRGNKKVRLELTRTLRNPGGVVMRATIRVAPFRLQRQISTLNFIAAETNFDP